MPACYEIDVEREVVFASYWGLVTLEEARAILKDVRSDPGFQPHFRVLADFTRATELGEGFADTASLVGFYRLSRGAVASGRVAYIASRRDAVYGTLRQFQAMIGEENRMRVFTDPAAARVWVGLPPTGTEGG